MPSIQPQVEIKDDYLSFPLTVLKSISSNAYHRREGCHRPEDVEIFTWIFTSSC